MEVEAKDNRREGRGKLVRNSGGDGNEEGTELFYLGQNGNATARSLAFGLVYGPLRGIAARLIRHEPAGCSAQATGLVAELYLRLMRLQSRVLNREHFLRLATNVMRNILVDHGRRRQTRKRFEPELVAMAVRREEGWWQEGRREEALDLWEKLYRIDARLAETVWMRAVEGATNLEVARRQGRPVWRVKADYEYGVQWLEERLGVGK